MHRSHYRMMILIAVVLAGRGLCPVAQGGGVHVGLDFIESQLVWEQDYLYWNVIEPFELTSAQGRLVQEGALAGWTEASARCAIALATDDAFRAVDTGDPDTTIAVQVYAGSAPANAAGRRFNLIMGQNSNPDVSYYGYAILNAAAGEAEFPNGSYVAVVFMDELSDLSAVTFDTADKAVNAIAGTSAHEIGHAFNLAHVANSDSQPYPIMATSTGADPLMDWDRVSVRCFSDRPGTQGASGSSASVLLSTVGVAKRADFDMDDDVDLQDAGQALLHWTGSAPGGRAGPRWSQGDADGDHDVDLQDVGKVVAYWTGAPDAGSYSAAGTYNYVTGEITVTVSAVEYLSIYGVGLLTGDDPTAIWNALISGSALVDDCDDFTGFWAMNNPQTFSGSIGDAAATGLGAGDLTMTYAGALGTDAITIGLDVIPEPGTMVLLGSGGIGLLLRRRRLP